MGLEGELVGYDSKLALFFQDTINIPHIFKQFHDIRMRPLIRHREYPYVRISHALLGPNSSIAA